MLYIISFILIITGILKKDSKTIFNLIWVFLLLLLGGNTANADQLSYMDNYNSLAAGKPGLKFEFGFQLLCKVSSFFGLSFQQFLFVLAFIGLALIASTIRLYTSNITYVLALYSIYPFIWDTVQIRNFIAMSIIIYGSRYVISYKKEYKKYILCVLAASSMHITSIFYFAFLLIGIKDTKKITKIVTAVTTGSIIFMPLVLNILKSFISAEKINAYFSTQTSLVTKSGTVIYFAVSITMVIIAKKIIELSNGEENSEKKNGLDTETVLQINLICIMFLYFVLNNLNFMRLYRNIFVLNYILFAVSLSKMKKTGNYYYFFWYALILAVLSFLVFTLYVSATNIFNPVFNNNVIFQWLQGVY